MKHAPRIMLATVCIAAALLVLASSAQAATPLPSTTVSNTGMVDFTDAGGTANAIAVRTIAQAGGTVWVGGRFDTIKDANGVKVADAANLAPFSAATGALVAGVHIPLVTCSACDPEVYDSSLGPDGNLYFAGDFDAVDGQTRHNVAAIDPSTGALLPFNPTGVGSASSVLATSTAVYVGTSKLLSFRLDSSPTLSWPNAKPPQASIDSGIRQGHVTLPQFRDIQIRGNTLIAACQCDSLTDVNGVRTVKAAVEIDATNGTWINWRPGGTDPSKGSYLDDQSAAFGINLVVHNAPGTSTPKVYLAAGGSDFTAAYDLSTGAQLWKTDTSGSSQAIAWYQGNVVVGGHYLWTASPAVVQANGSCGNNEQPNTDCYYTPKLVAMNGATGAVLLDGTNRPWNPGICCKYNGVWALLVGNDGSTLHVGGEFIQAGGTWDLSCTAANGYKSSCLNGKTLQQYYARFAGPSPATQTLTVQQPGPGGGSGTVTSAPNGINCGSTCAIDFSAGTGVTLTATAAAGSTFTGWSSPDTGFSCPGTGTCTVSMNQARTVVATFAPISFQLTVTKTGSGTGTVTSSPSGVTCGGTCASFFVQGTVVTLAATPGTNAAFSGWSGDCTGTGTCQVTMSQARDVTASFTPLGHKLTVNKLGTGSGSVVSSPSGINCGSTCGPKTFTDPTVTLTATPAGGSAFAGWSSSDPGFSCPGAGTCTVSMDIDRTVTADFEPAKTITVTSPFSGTGSGTVTSAPGGITCPSTCAASFVQGSTVTLTAAPDATSSFVGWSGNCTPSGPLTCTIPASGTVAQRTVSATFAAAQTLTVTPAGTGGGSVTSAPAGIDCGLTCQANFANGTSVTLTATPDVNSTFTGWSGGGCSGTGTCQVSMNAGTSVTATFTPKQRTMSLSIGGQGTITSNPDGIDCTTGNAGTCNATFEHGSDVELDATPDANWAFTGWGGACSGTDPVCIVTMDGDQTVTATFSQLSRTVDVSFDGSGTGSVTSSPSGIDCPASTCSASFTQGASMTLTATADPGSVFTGWSGGSCSGTGDCALTIDGAKSVVATFEPLLTLDVSTSGSGSVTSDSGGIDCPGTCSAQYALGTTVTLTANPGTGSSFAGWGGACSGAATTCQVTVDTAKSVSASFGSTQQLGVSVTGAGTGSVTSSPAGISCASGGTGSCSAGFAQGATVTLTAAPDAGSVVASWGGDCSTATGTTCQLTMDQPHTASVDLEPSHVLTVQPAGTGTGSVSSTPSGITCPSTCSASFQDGTQVTLNATPDQNMTFDGWSGGACSGTGSCTLTVSADTSVTATFTTILDAVSVTEQGTGGGTVTSSPSGITCPSTCTANFAQGSTVALTATPDAQSVFTGWTGDCTGTTTCQLSVDAAENVTATFDKAPRQLSVSVTGSGSVASNPAGIACPTTCSANFPDGTVVTLTETPSGTAAFGGWAGACSGTATSCQVTMSAATSVSATFTSAPSPIEEMDPSVAYNGWTGVADATASGGTYRVSAVKSDKATWKSPTATSLTWVTRTGPNLGIAKVTIDGTSVGNVDLYAPTAQAFSQTYPGLTSKVHTVIVTVTGNKNAASIGTGVVVDAFTAGTTTDQDASAKVKYDTWTSAASTKASGGTYRWATASTAKVTVTFTGTGIDWITALGPAYGKASVTIDGLSKGTVDLYASSAKWQQAQSYGGLASGVHTMVIQVLGTKNASSTSTKVVVDAFKTQP